jgi:hypothetical protein
MTREEQILNKAIDYSEIEENFLEYDDCGDVCDDKTFIEKAFIEGANWADEHPNLYNNEKYHTVKVSCLDELARKAALYDEFLKKAYEWLLDNTGKYMVISGGGYWFNDIEFIKDFKTHLEE